MLMRAQSAALLIVDIQARLAAAVQDAEQVIARTRILMQAAGRLGVPILVSEQYPKGLGPTDDRLGPLPRQAAVIAKTSFSCAREPQLRATLDRLGRSQIVLCGMETHVCVLQTALDLRESGQDVFVVADAVGSRSEASRRLGLERLRDHGVDVVDSEMVLFEWLERAGTDAFRELSALIK
jgi:nicotinamidase-related amidase